MTEVPAATAMQARPRIAFFDYADVFEDFYTHYGVDQKTFATQWDASGNHCFVRLLQSAVGDVTWYCLSLAPALEHARHERTGACVRFFRSSGLHRLLWKAFYLPRAAWRWRGAYPWFAVLASYTAPLSWRLLASLLRERPHAVFTQDYANGKFDELLLLARLLGVPLVAYHSGSSPGRYLGKRFKRWTIRRADLLLVSSEREREQLIERYGAAPARVKVVLTPVDMQRYRPMPRTDAARRMQLDPGRRYLLFVGRLDDEVKRVSALLRSFSNVAALFHDVDLIVVGDGPDAAALHAIAEPLGERVRFTGWLGDEADKIALMSIAHALVLPSRNEGFPTVLGEAMACATPVIASDVGGIAELVVPGRTGMLVTPDDEQGLAAALHAMLACAPEVHAQFRARAREIAERRVSESVVVDQLRSSIGALARG